MDTIDLITWNFVQRAASVESVPQCRMKVLYLLKA